MVRAESPTDFVHHASAAPVRAVSDVGRVVAEARRSRGLTQQQFADLAGVGRRFVSELESGKPTAEIGKVLQVLNALGLDVILKAR